MRDVIVQLGAKEREREREGERERKRERERDGAQLAVSELSVPLMFGANDRAACRNY